MIMKSGIRVACSFWRVVRVSECDNNNGALRSIMLLGVVEAVSVVVNYLRLIAIILSEKPDMKHRASVCIHLSVKGRECANNNDATAEACFYSTNESTQRDFRIVYEPSSFVYQLCVKKTN